MKALRQQLAAAGIDVSSLAPLYESGDERGFQLRVTDGMTNDAEDTWDVLRELVEKTGYWPVILGDDDERASIAEDASRKSWGPTQKLIDRSLKYTGEEFLSDAFDVFLSNEREKVVDRRESGEEEWASALEAALATDDPFRCMPRGTWPQGKPPNNCVSTPYHYSTGEHLPEVFIGLVPTTVSWQVPIYLHFGGFNACPRPDDVGSMLRYWQEKYGAELMCLKLDTLELGVARPPKKRQEALLLAREQFLFCEDIVGQGTRTIESLAAELLKATRWFFWWD